MKNWYIILITLIPLLGLAKANKTNPNEIARYAAYDINMHRTYMVHVIGTGSGQISVTAMAGYLPGDQIQITDGTYTNAVFDNLRGITIRPKNVRTYFTGQVEFRNNNFVDWGYATWNNISGSAIDMRAYTGNITNCTLHNMTFNNVGDVCILAHGNYLYTKGDTTTYAWYKVTLDSITEFKCIQLVAGSYGQASDNNGAPPDVFWGTTITHLNSVGTTSTSGEGTEIRGILWHSNFHDWTVTSTTQRLASGDCGLIYGHGSGNFYNIYKSGGPGYIIRIAPNCEVNSNDSINIFNCIKANGTEYGLACVQWSSGDSVAGKFGNVQAVNIYNNTLINAATHITYWCQIAVMGDKGLGVHWQIRNNLGINIATTGKPNKIIMNQGVGWLTMASDTSNNQYYDYAINAGVDTTSILITNALGNFSKYNLTSQSSAQAAGTLPFSNTDFMQTAWRKPPSIGYLQYVNVCKCMLRPMLPTLATNVNN